MKSWMLLPFALLLGWVMGSWLPKAELRASQQELAVALASLRTPAPRGNKLAGVTQILGIEGSGERRNSAPVATTIAPIQAESPAAESQDAVTGQVSAVESTASVEATADGDNRSMARNIEQAIELWDARVGIARSTFVSNAGLSQKETEHFDVLVDAMNVRLAHSIEQFAAHVADGGEVGEVEGIKLLRDMTSAMAMTYDEMDASLPEAWQKDGGKDFSLTDFIDPAVALPLTELDGALEGTRFMGRQ